MKHIYTIFITFLLIFSSSAAFSQQDNKLYTHPISNSDSKAPQDFFETREWQQPPFNPEWVGNDVLVDTGEVYNLGIRPLAVKMGPDGYLYLAHNKKAPGGQPFGRINLFRSHNGGQNWALIGSVSTTTAYFGQISLLAENRTPSVPDSTRIIIFYTRSTSFNLVDASLYWASIRRNGTGFIGGTQVGFPSPGGKFFYPAAVSNGQYEDANTSFGAVVGEYNNISEVSISFRYYRTSNWGATFESAVITDPLYPTVSEYFPSADFKKGSTDSIYIACERRSATDSTIRIISTPWVPTANAVNRYQVTPTGTDNYEKPVITIMQNGAYANDQRQIMITMIRTGGRATYSYSTNSGASWVNNNSLGLPTQTRTRFAYCSSDSNITGGGNFVACFVNNNGNSGDSVSVVRGTLQSMVGLLTKVNQFNSSFVVSPVCAVYNNGVINYSTVAYAGTGPVNVYLDGENLPVNIFNNGGEVPNSFRISQNYPNPFNPSTKINFSVPSSSMIKLIVYDVLGKEVASLVNGRHERGNYTVNFDASKLSGGVYFYRLITESFSETKKMLLVK